MGSLFGKKKNNTAALLKQQQKEAQAAAAKERQEAQRLADAGKRARLGRASLIKTSELGVSDELG